MATKDAQITAVKKDVKGRVVTQIEYTEMERNAEE